MIANPGGYIDPAHLIGRDKLVEQIWKILERQSVVLIAERRIGKTSILNKMVKESPTGVFVRFSELEAVNTPLEFAKKIYHDVEPNLSWFNWSKGKVRQVLEPLTGFKVAGVIDIPEMVARSWKNLLVLIIEDLVKHQKHRVIFLWDEIPYMLNNIKKRNGEAAAMEVLDILRSLRQTHPNLRMVFTGSIGLHNVITSLKRAGYANAPINDMYTQDVPPLSASDAERLALQLLKGESIPTEDDAKIAQEIATAGDYIPYYIHWIVDRLKDCEQRVNAAIVSQMRGQLLADDQDCMNLRYFRERIDEYYTQTEQPVALKLLDILASSSRSLPLDEVLNLLRSHQANVEEEQVHEVLKLLRHDHYIQMEPDGTYHFRFSLIQQWWRMSRGGRA